MSQNTHNHSKIITTYALCLAILLCMSIISITQSAEAATKPKFPETDAGIGCSVVWDWIAGLRDKADKNGGILSEEDAQKLKRYVDHYKKYCRGAYGGYPLEGTFNPAISSTGTGGVLETPNKTLPPQTSSTNSKTTPSLTIPQSSSPPTQSSTTATVQQSTSPGEGNPISDSGKDIIERGKPDFPDTDLGKGCETTWDTIKSLRDKAERQGNVLNSVDEGFLDALVWWYEQACEEWYGGYPLKGTFNPEITSSGTGGVENPSNTNPNGDVGESQEGQVNEQSQDTTSPPPNPPDNNEGDSNPGNDDQSEQGNNEGDNNEQEGGGQVFNPQGETGGIIEGGEVEQDGQADNNGQDSGPIL